MALAHIDAAHGDERRGAEVVFFGAEQRRINDVLAGAHAAVGAQGHPVSQSVEKKHLMGLGDAHLPGPAGVLDRTQRRGAGAAFVSADQNDVGVRLGHACRDRSDPSFGHKLHADTRAAIDLLQIVNQLRQIFDGVNIMMRRGRDERHPRQPHAEAWRYTR